MKKLTLLLALLIGLTGCITGAASRAPHANDPEWQKEWEQHREEREQAERDVRVTANQEVVRGCKFLGNVRSHGGSTASVERQLRAKAVGIDANTMFMESENSNNGEAYLCPDPAAVKEKP